ncbi:hypothetical protein HPCPY6271_0517 [Helicobacter pylori CPY6271]|nr:hypothetical protein HPCPY6271_0517 [Helicobacter pylori CPY6271]
MSFNALFVCFYAFLMVIYHNHKRKKLSRFPFLISIFYTNKSAYSSY